MNNSIKIMGLCSLICLFTSGAHAGEPFYIGGSLGYSTIDTPDSNVFGVAVAPTGSTISETSSQEDKGGLGGSLYVGYDITSSWAVELGYTLYGESDYQSSQSQYNGGGQTTASNTAKLEYSSRSYDLFLKGTKPLSGGLSLFGKIGASYVSQNNDYTTQNNSIDIPVDSNDLTALKNGSHTYSAFRPAGALGASYRINSTLSTSLFIQGFMGQGDFDTDQDAIAAGYLVGLGISAYV